MHATTNKAAKKTTTPVQAESSAHTRKWQKRRQEIIAAAETVFADKGFTATRLEDVALVVDVRRASLVYYFEDKEALYDAVAADIYSSLVTIIRNVEAPKHARLEAVIKAWIEFLSHRPTAARIFLREAVDSLSIRRTESSAALGALLTELQHVLKDGFGGRDLDLQVVMRFAMTVAGCSLFWVAAQPVAKANLGFDSLSPENLQMHRQILVQLTEQLMQMPAAKKVRK